MTLAEVYQVQDIQDAGTASGLIRIKVKIDRIEPLVRTIHHRHTEKYIIKPETDFKTTGNRGDKKTGIIALSC